MTDRPLVAVVVFPGSNDDRDAAWALGAVGAEPVLIWHQDAELPADVGAVVLPGGFSYGDYLRTGAIASVSPVMDAVRAFATAGGPVLGICNGFQILCEARLLPGVLRANKQLEFVCRDATLRVDSTASPVMGRCSLGQELVIPVKHGEGAWYADEGTFVQLAARGQIVLRYAEDVNGALGNVAGVVNEAGNVMGLMPHPEHAVDPLLGSADGGLLLAALVDAATDAPRCARACVGARAHLARRAALEPKRLLQNGRALERRPQSLEVARPHGDGTAPRGPVGRVGEADEPLSVPGFEELNDDSKPLVADALWNRCFLEERRRAPWRRRGGRLGSAFLRSAHRRSRHAARLGA